MPWWSKRYRVEVFSTNHNTWYPAGPQEYQSLPSEAMAHRLMQFLCELDDWLGENHEYRIREGEDN